MALLQAAWHKGMSVGLDLNKPGFKSDVCHLKAI